MLDKTCIFEVQHSLGGLLPLQSPHQPVKAVGLSKLGTVGTVSLNHGS